MRPLNKKAPKGLVHYGLKYAQLRWTVTDENFEKYGWMTFEKFKKAVKEEFDDTFVAEVEKGIKLHLKRTKIQ